MFWSPGPPDLKNMHHINKVMAIATVGYYFTDEMRNGGEGILLSMYRSQKAKIAKKTQYPRVRRPDGTWYYDKSNGPLYRKGDPVMCDTVCVGSPKGTPSDPKFDLQTMWILNIFPLIEALVGDGGRCEGAQVVIQGDGAGPHRERAYAKRMTDECKERGWIWDTQAPHMPHSNVLDLYIFPAMSKNHDKERNSHSSMLSKEQIWENAEAVWNKITSQEIAKAFLVLDGVLDKVIKKKGEVKGVINDLHNKVRAKYKPSNFGMELKRKAEAEQSTPKTKRVRSQKSKRTRRQKAKHTGPSKKRRRIAL